MAGMLFGLLRRRSDPREGAWAAFAAEFELEPANELDALLRQQFALGSGRLAPIFALTRSGQPQVVACDQVNERKGPAGTARGVRTLLLLRDPDPAATQSEEPLSLRASAKRTAAFEALEASRSGATRLSFENAPEFDAAVSVYARDVGAATAVLTPTVRRSLRALLGGADGLLREVDGKDAGGLAPSTVAPRLIVGQNNLLLMLEPRAPLPLASLGSLLTDLLTVHAAFMGAAAAVRRS